MQAPKVKGGGEYRGNQQYAGGGVMRFCSYCNKHRAPAGSKKTPRGWKCKACQEKKA